MAKAIRLGVDLGGTKTRDRRARRVTAVKRFAGASRRRGRPDTRQRSQRSRSPRDARVRVGKRAWPGAGRGDRRHRHARLDLPRATGLLRGSNSVCSERASDPGRLGSAYSAARSASRTTPIASRCPRPPTARVGARMSSSASSSARASARASSCADACSKARTRIAGEWGHNPLPWPRDDERPGLVLLLRAALAASRPGFPDPAWRAIIAASPDRKCATTDIVAARGAAIRPAQKRSPATRTGWPARWRT